jgi:hypothetical protein
MVSGNFAEMTSFLCSLGIFYLLQICDVGPTALLPPPKEGMLRIFFFTQKVRRLWLGLNPHFSQNFMWMLGRWWMSHYLSVCIYLFLWYRYQLYRAHMNTWDRRVTNTKWCGFLKWFVVVGIGKDMYFLCTKVRCKITWQTFEKLFMLSIFMLLPEIRAGLWVGRAGPLPWALTLRGCQKGGHRPATRHSVAL